MLFVDFWWVFWRKNDPRDKSVFANILLSQIVNLDGVVDLLTNFSEIFGLFLVDVGAISTSHTQESAQEQRPTTCANKIIVLSHFLIINI